jgi:PEGA domain
MCMATKKTKKTGKAQSKLTAITENTTEQIMPINMNVIRVVIIFITLVIVFAIATTVFLYAKGFRFNKEDGTVSPHGLMVLKSVPDGAQIFVNGVLKTATNATISLEESVYDITIKKEGFKDWNKRMALKNEEVTEATAYLFTSAPSLSALTFAGISAVVPNDELTKLAYIVPLGTPPNNNEELAGLWVIETLNLPLGFSREPRRITDGNLVGAEIEWSPDGRQLLLTTKTGLYLLETTAFTPQERRVNIQTTKEVLFAQWADLAEKQKLDSLTKLPEELQSILNRKTSQLVFSPDENMVIYTASGSATIPPDLIPDLPGSSSQPEQRELEDKKTYLYDIKEDKNFLIDNAESALSLGEDKNAPRRLSWFPTSRHLVLAEEQSVTILDYDGTNRQAVYKGSYVAPHAYPAVSSDRLTILTNLGATGTLPNLYSLSIR